jgi:sucrose-6-phosphate hydrolase SacC (GH32 family)
MASKNLPKETNEVVTNDKTKGTRNRGANYSRDECKLLLQCVIQEIKCIEDKRTDSTTWKEKEKKWIVIASRFNAQTIGGVSILLYCTVVFSY